MTRGNWEIGREKIEEEQTCHVIKQYFTCIRCIYGTQ